jgi:uncharacterized protein YyaL (SSP411 family)
MGKDTGSDTMPEQLNALGREKSPYLLQHAHNPVEWHAWNEESIALARREDKPIFLSIGYSTCHWCHVMAHESFEDPTVAAVMNKCFINIKVDREERPDIDQTYMLAVQAMGQQGGWPLSAWLTPDLKPFYGGTYFPPRSMYGRPGFVDILERIHELWTTDRTGLVGQAERLSGALSTAVRSAAPASDLTPAILDAGFQTFASMYDAEHGGFGQAPKFPRPVGLAFLLRYHHRTGNRDALAMVVQTLRAMALGGIHDHVGGGFARYSVDAEWRVPHFEKMLYDQAQLMQIAAQVYQITGLEDMAAVVKDIAGYVRRELTDAAGGFYSAEDADSVDANGVSREGAFYAWTPAQLADALGTDAAAVVAAYFDVTEAGTFEHGESVLHVSTTLPEMAEKFGRTEDEIRALLTESLRKLFAVRARRRRPHLDDKVLTAWNGLMISALSQAAQALGDDSFLSAARAAADFILGTLWDAETRTLTRRYRDGEAAVDGFLDDHAFFTGGLLDLYEASLEPRYLTAAVEIAAAMMDKFHDAEAGGFYFTADSAPAGMARRKDDYDGAEPSGNSMAALVLFRLAEMTGNSRWRDAAEGTVRAVSGILSAHPETMPAMLGALDAMLTPPRQVAVAGDLEGDDTRLLLRSVQQLYRPHTTLLHAGPALAPIAPWLAEMGTVDGRAAAYVCENFACQTPTTDADALRRSLGAPER